MRLHVNISTISAILLSIALCQASYADNLKMSDKTDWLKQNLKALKAKTDTVSSPKPANLNKAPVQSKLRPFVANRRLPSEKDYQTTAYPTNAGEPNAGEPLSGQITMSTQVGPPAPSLYRPSSDQDFFNEAQSALKSNRTNKRSIKAKSIARNGIVPEPSSVLNQNKINIPSNLNLPQPQNSDTAGGQLNYTQSAIEQPTGITPLSDQVLQNAISQLRKSNSTAQEGVSSTESSDEGFGSAGPPPFPLNLLPPQTLKAMMGRAFYRPKGQVSYSNQIAGNQNSYAHLHQANMPSYVGLINNRNIRSMLPRTNYMTRGRICPVLAHQVRSTRPTTSRPITSTQTTNKTATISTGQSQKVLVYPPYEAPAGLFTF